MNSNGTTVFLIFFFLFFSSESNRPENNRDRRETCLPILASFSFAIYQLRFTFLSSLPCYRLRISTRGNDSIVQLHDRRREMALATRNESRIVSINDQTKVPITGTISIPLWIISFLCKCFSLFPFLSFSFIALLKSRKQIQL